MIAHYQNGVLHVLNPENGEIVHKWDQDLDPIELVFLAIGTITIIDFENGVPRAGFWETNTVSVQECMALG